MSQRTRISSFMILASGKVAVLSQLYVALLKGFLRDAEVLTMLALHKKLLRSCMMLLKSYLLPTVGRSL